MANETDLIVKPARSKADDLVIGAVFRKVDKALKERDDLDELQRIIVEDGAGLYSFILMCFCIQQSPYKFPKITDPADWISNAYLNWIARDSDEVDAFFARFQQANKVNPDPKSAPPSEVSASEKK